MSKYSEVVALLEWVEKKDKKEPKEKEPKEYDIPALIRKKKEEAAVLEKLLIDFNNSEREKNKVRNLTGFEWFVLGILMYPVVGPLYRIATHNFEVFSGAVK